MMHRVYHKFPNFTSNNGTPTALIYGVPMLLQSAIRDTEADKVYVVFDGDHNPMRDKILPDYKKREPKLGFDAEAFYQQMSWLVDNLNSFGVHVVHQRGHEADDWICILARKLKAKHHVDILSGDKDFHQLIRDNVWVYNQTHKRFIKPHSCKHHYNYTPKECVDYLVLDGDKSDNIPGYPGFGPKTIRKFLDEHKSIRSFLKSDKSFGRVDKELMKEIYIRNKTLIDLVRFTRKYMKGLKVPIKKGKFDKKEIKRFAITYDIKTFTKTNFLEIYETLK